MICIWGVGLDSIAIVPLALERWTVWLFRVLVFDIVKSSSRLLLAK
jgi:hypothetical protein